MNTPTEQLHPPVMAPGDYTRYKVILGTLGVVVPLLVAVLFYFKGIFKISGADAYLHALPAANAVLNSLTAVALLVGYYFIRHKNVVAYSCSRTLPITRKWKARTLGALGLFGPSISCCC
jgi:putative membrane protein